MSPASIAQVALIALALVALIAAAARARRLCVLSIRRGKLLIMQGSLPTSLLEALADVVARDGSPRGTLVVRSDGGRARLDASGLSPEGLQRARNVLGTYSLTRLRNAPRTRHRNLGQRLGSAWLAWHLHDRARARRRGPEA